MLKKIFVSTLCLVGSMSIKASVDQLFLKSLHSSKQVEVFDLTKEKSLSELDSLSSTLYPSVGLVSKHQYGNNGIVSSSEKDEIDSQVGLSFEQKIFQGGAEFAIIDYKNIVPKMAKAQKEQNLAGYYSQFTTLYFEFSSALEEKNKVEALLSNLKQRVEIVRKRTRIGRDRKADLSALESQYYRLQSDLHANNAKLNSAQTNFLNFSGLVSVQSVIDTTDPLSLNLVESPELSDIPNLKTLRLGVQSSSLAVDIEKSSYYPQVDIAANYYLDKTSLGRNDLEVTLNLKLNLLDFGQRSSKVQTKKLDSLIAKAKFDYSRLNSKREWRDFVKNFTSKKNEYKSLKQALLKSRNSYKEQLADLGKGLVTQIDVIRSLDDVIDLEKLSIRSSLEVKSLYYKANAYLGNYPKG